MNPKLARIVNESIKIGSGFGGIRQDRPRGFRLDFGPAVVLPREDCQVRRRPGNRDGARVRAGNDDLHGLPDALNRAGPRLPRDPGGGGDGHGDAERDKRVFHAVESTPDARGRQSDRGRGIGHACRVGRGNR